MCIKTKYNGYLEFQKHKTRHTLIYDTLNTRKKIISFIKQGKTFV